MLSVNNLGGFTPSHRRDGTFTFFSNDFETGVGVAQTIAPLVGSGAEVIVNSPVFTGTQAIYDPSPSGGSTNYMTYQFKNNAPLSYHNLNGIYFRWCAAYDQAALDNAFSSGQFKGHLARYLGNGSGNPGGFMTGMGDAFFGEGGSQQYQIVIAADDNISIIPGSSTGVPYTALTYIKQQVWYFRDQNNNTGYGKFWIYNNVTQNWDKKVDFSHKDDGSYSFLKNADTNIDQLYLMIGIPFSNVSGSAYTDHVKAANYFIQD